LYNFDLYVSYISLSAIPAVIFVINPLFVFTVFTTTLQNVSSMQCNDAITVSHMISVSVSCFALLIATSVDTGNKLHYLYSVIPVAGVVQYTVFQKMFTPMTFMITM